MVFHPLTQDQAFNCLLELPRPCLPPLGSVHVRAREAWQLNNMLVVVVVEQEDCGDHWKEGLGSVK